MFTILVHYVHCIVLVAKVNTSKLFRQKMTSLHPRSKNYATKNRK